MHFRPLPNDPSLEHLKKQAKRLLEAVRSGQPQALEWVKELHPRATEALAAFKLSDAQLVAARAYGFASWPKLVRHLELVDRFRKAPSSLSADGEFLADRLVRIACLDYAEWNLARGVEARQLFAEHPELARASIYTAATVGDVSAVRALLAADRELARRAGGPHGWEPLLYACYSRLDSPDPAHSTLAVARELLAAGADPDAGFLWHGNVPPFTALTGAFGEGENGNNHPPHRDRDALARLLLDAGADPNDGQTLYNRHFRSANDHLVLLFEYGLGQEPGGAWYRRLGARLHAPAVLVAEELWSAAKNGFLERVELLVAHGVAIDRPGVRDGRTPYEVALRAGNREIAELLALHGARAPALAPLESFASACAAGDREAVRALLAKEPDLVERLGLERRIETLQQAAAAGRGDAVRLLAELGFELSALLPGRSGLDRTALHEAAWAGDLDMVELLLELGADPKARDSNFDATPLGWAEHNHQQAVVERLRTT